MLKIKEAILVEGVYDKIKLDSIVDALILTADGFSIFHDKEKMSLLYTIAQKRGLIIFTDPDRAGFMIRNYVKQRLDPSCIKHAFIPDVYGKEKRKAHAGKEGKLGIEGVQAELILSALRRAGATILPEAEIKTPSPKEKPITKLDFYNDGLIGGYKSAAKRRKFVSKLGLPTRISTNMLVHVINSLISYEEYRKLVDELSAEPF